MFFLVLILGLFADVYTDSVAFYLTSEPVDTWVKRGQSISLSCDVSTTIDTVYEWRLHTDLYDSSTLLEETSSSLIYGPWNENMNGLFVSCTADVLGTKLKSRYALIRVSYLDTVFGAVPSDTTAASGQDHIRLACGAPAGRPAPYITWQKDGSDVDEAHSFVDPLGGLNIINLDADDTGSYTCTANSFQGFDPVVSSAANLIIQGTVTTSDLPTTYDVSFATARYKISARQGDTVRVLCGFLGTPTPTFDIGNGSTGQSFSSGGKYTVGKHKTWMNVKNVDEIGGFECEGTNNGGSQKLNIGLHLQKTVVVSGGKAVEIVEKDSTVLVCSVSGASDPKYSWYKNGEIISGENNPLLEFTSTAREESGLYQCFVTTDSAKEHTTFSLSVSGTTTVPVKVTVIGETVYGLVGSSYALSCVGQGNPVPEVTWYRSEGNSETAISVSKILFKETFTEMLAVLRFASLTADDDSNVYLCKGTNKDLYDSSKVYDAEYEYVMKVVEPITPVVLLPTESIATTGKSFTLICGVTGSPPPTVRWLKDGVEIDDATSASFVIDSLSNADGGDYSCIAENQIAVVSAVVTVVPTPALTGGQVFLVLIIVAVLLLFLAVGFLIIIRRNELDRRAAEIKAKEDLFNEKEKRDELPIASHPYQVAPVTPNGFDGQDNIGYDVEGGELGVANGTPGTDPSGDVLRPSTPILRSGTPVLRPGTPVRSVIVTRSGTPGSRPITPAQV